MSDNPPVLLDTSIWIDYFRNQSPELSAAVDNLIASDQARVCGIIIAELIRGAKTGKEVEALVEVADTIRAVPEPRAVWEKAGRLAYDLRRKGRTIHVVDCYLAELAIASDCRLFTLDQHFKMIQKFRPVLQPFKP